MNDTLEAELDVDGIFTEETKAIERERRERKINEVEEIERRRAFEAERNTFVESKLREVNVVLKKILAGHSAFRDKLQGTATYYVFPDPLWGTVRALPLCEERVSEPRTAVVFLLRRKEKWHIALYPCQRPRRPLTYSMSPSYYHELPPTLWDPIFARLTDPKKLVQMITRAIS